MFDRVKKNVGAIILVLALTAGSGCAVSRAPVGRAEPFDFGRDTFAFANETVWRYADGKPVGNGDRPNGDDVRYTRRCFLMSEAVVQFWKTARFDTNSPALSQKELARRIRQVRSFPVWHDNPPTEKRVVFPGYANLRDLSEREGPLLRATMGPGWTTYFDLRKFPMPFVPNRKDQAHLYGQMSGWIAAGHPMILWLYNFPHVTINHCVVAYAADEPSSTQGRRTFRVVDPNYTDRPRRLEYDPVSREFFFEPTFYFGGGFVAVRPMYLGRVR